MCSISAAALPGAAPTRCMPVSILTCTPTGSPAPAAAAAASASTYAATYTVGMRRWRTSVGDLIDRLLAQHQDRGRRRRPHAGATPSAVERDAQPGGAGRERALGDRDRAVAVAVGLDHRPHRRRVPTQPRNTPTLCSSAARSISAHAQRARGHRHAASTSGNTPTQVAGDEAALWQRRSPPARGAMLRPAAAERSIDAAGEQGADDASEHIARCRRWRVVDRRWRRGTPGRRERRRRSSGP